MSTFSAIVAGTCLGVACRTLQPDHLRSLIASVLFAVAFIVSDNR